jgi:uncharacterized protein (DUF952 family)
MWIQAKALGQFAALSLSSEGFIHMSRVHQALHVANARFRGHGNLVLLQIDEEKVTAEIRYEGDTGNLFPHIYGPINLEAVVQVFDFPEGANGFALPPDFAATTLD